MSSLAECSNLGHQHPRLVAAIREQAQRLCFVTNAWGAQPRAELAQALLERSGFEGGRVFFTLGGADANETRGQDRAPGRGQAARRGDRARPLVPRRHAPRDGAVRRQPHAQSRSIRRPSACITCRRPMPIAARSTAATTTQCGELAADAVAERIDALGADQVAAVVMEAECRHQRHRRARTPTGRRCAGTPRERGVWLIADEVMSAFGRCGEWFAWQRHGEAGRPDLMTLAKGLTGARAAAGRGGAQSRGRRAASSTRCSTPA